jgi:hypothetical protein
LGRRGGGEGCCPEAVVDNVIVLGEARAVYCCVDITINQGYYLFTIIYTDGCVISKAPLVTSSYLTAMSPTLIDLTTIIYHSSDPPPLPAQPISPPSSPNTTPPSPNDSLPRFPIPSKPHILTSLDHKYSLRSSLEEMSSNHHPPAAAAAAPPPTQPRVHLPPDWQVELYASCIPLSRSLRND